jgi:hypothetical protein
MAEEGLVRRAAPAVWTTNGVWDTAMWFKT